MKISVIIPVVNSRLAVGLLNSIARNTKLPYKILIIDNTKNGFYLPSNILDIQIYRPPVPMSVNEAWQYGMDRCQDSEAVSVLNDDILLGTQFFERTERVLNTSDGVCCSVPYTVADVNDMVEYPSTEHEIVGVGKREGWAFTIKMDIFDQLPRFPHEKIKTFCFDDWLFLFSNSKSYGKWEWYKDLKNVIWHQGGVAVRKLGKRVDKKPERRIYEEEANKVLKCRN